MCSFQENTDDINNDDDNYKDNNNNYDISTLEPDREPEFTRTCRADIFSRIKMFLKPYVSIMSQI